MIGIVAIAAVEGVPSAMVSWWDSFRPPLRMSRTATYAHSASTGRALLSLAATGLVFVALGVAFFTTLHWLIFNPPIWGPVRSLWECFEEDAVDAFLMSAAFYAAATALLAVAGEATVWLTSRRLRRKAGRSALNALQKMTMGVKAAAASSPAVLWTGVAFATPVMLVVPITNPPTTAPWYTTVVRSAPLYALPLVTGAGLIWALVVATRCGTKTVDHAYRVRCVRCGYDLQGTPGDRCSECGMPLPPSGQDAGDVETSSRLR